MFKKIFSIKKRQPPVTKKTIPLSRPLSFIPPLEKKISKKQISVFWKSYFSGELSRFVLKRTSQGKQTNISIYNKKVYVFPISKTSLVNVRVIGDRRTTLFFKARYAYLKEVVPKLNLKRSKVSISEILDIREANKQEHILERVFPSISIADFEKICDLNISSQNLSKVNRYAPSFMNSLKKNNITLESFSKDLKKAYKELTTNKQLNGHTDLLENNVIILGYDKQKSTFHFGLIDYFGAVSKSFS